MIQLIVTSLERRAKRHSHYIVCLVLLCLCLLTPATAFAQTQTSEAPLTGELIIEGETKINDEKIVLQRKRFYLIKGTLQENKALVDKIQQTSSLFPTRECFYRTAKASEAFINWLKEVDCESVYCQPIEEKYLTGAEAVPEFQEAFKLGTREYKSAELGRLWLATNLSEVIRDGFYRYKQTALKALIGESQTDATTRDNSVMTGRNGQAYFTGLLPGKYVVSNLIPIEIGGKLIVWTCEVDVTPGPNALDIPGIIDSKPTDSSKTEKCNVFKMSLPACNANTKSTSIK